MWDGRWRRIPQCGFRSRHACVDGSHELYRMPVLASSADDRWNESIAQSRGQSDERSQHGRTIVSVLRISRRVHQKSGVVSMDLRATEPTVAYRVDVLGRRPEIAIRRHVEVTCASWHVERQSRSARPGSQSICELVKTSSRMHPDSTARSRKWAD